jgi:membrane protease YdiL (CAAX protease family)
MTSPGGFAPSGLEPALGQSHAAPQAPWSDLLLYLLVGFGAFLGASVLIGLSGLPAGSLTLLAIGLANLICLGGSVYLLGIRRRRLTWAELGLFPPRWNWLWLVAIVSVTLALIPLRAALAYLALVLLEGGLESLQARSDLLTADLSWQGFLASLFVVGLLAPLSEELFFRGALYTWLRRRFSAAVAILGSALLFGLAHLDSVGVAVSSLIMGLVMGAFYERTRSLWATIAIHVLNNSLGVILLYLALAIMRFFPELRTS